MVDKFKLFGHFMLLYDFFQGFDCTLKVYHIVQDKILADLYLHLHTASMQVFAGLNVVVQ